MNICMSSVTLCLGVSNFALFYIYTSIWALQDEIKQTKQTFQIWALFYQKHLGKNARICQQTYVSVCNSLNNHVKTSNFFFKCWARKDIHLKKTFDALA